MKRQLLFLTLTWVLITAKAQTTVEVKWPLTNNNSALISPTVAGITASNQSTGSSVQSSYLSYSQTFMNGASTDWQKLATLPLPWDDNFYLEYKITANAGNYYQINKIVMEVVGSGGSNNALKAAYSLDNFANSSPLATNLNMATYNSQPNATPPSISTNLATTDDPIILINANPTSANALDIRPVLTFPNLNINIAPGQSLTIRIYPLKGGTTGTRFIASKNVVVTGRIDTQPIPNLTLPLDFLNFRADRKTNGTELHWTTTNEVNTSHFSIEKSTGKDFVSVGTLAAYHTAGINNYAFIDKDTKLSGIVYYKIKQIDKDGRYSYSKTIYVSMPSNSKVYPNPTKGRLYVKILEDGLSDLNVYNMQGKVIKSFKVEKNLNDTSIDLSDLPNQLLVIEIKNQNIIHKHFIIKN
jgi:Secretion system C-terminal sorting domain